MLRSLLTEKHRWLFFVLFFFYALFSWSLGTDEEMELGAYAAPGRSILCDGDLNVLDQLPAETSWSLTSTFNHPSYYDKGLSALWFPFLAYERLLFAFNVGNPAELIWRKHVVFYVLTFFFLSLLLLLVYRVNSQIFGERSVFGSVAAVASLPTLYCTVFNPTTSEISVALLATVLLYLMLNSGRSLKEAFVLGLFAGFGAAAKVHLYFFLLLFPVFVLFFRHEKERWLGRVVAYFLGLSVLGICVIVNSVITTGKLSLPYGGISFMPEFFILGPMVLGYEGFFRSTPVLALLTAGLPFGLWISRATGSRLFVSQRMFFVAISVAVVCLFVFASAFRFVMGTWEFPYARFLVAYLPLFSIMLSYLDQALAQKGRLRAGFRLLVTGCVVWALYYQVNSYFWVDWQIISALKLILSRLVMGMRQWQEFLVAFVFLVPLLTVAFFIFDYVWRVTKKTRELPSRWWLVMAVLPLTFVLFTVLNGINNGANVERLKALGKFDEKVIFAGPRGFFYDELVDSLAISKRYYQKVGDTSMLNRISDWENHFFRQIEAEVLQDPIGFSKQVAQGEFRKSYWDDSSEAWNRFIQRKMRGTDYCAD